MKKSERTIQEDFRLMKRGIREFRKILPGQMGLLAWKSVITAVTPYIAVVMSAGGGRGQVQAVGLYFDFHRSHFADIHDRISAGGEACGGL